MKNLIFTSIVLFTFLNFGWSQNIVDTIFFEDGGIDAYTKSTASSTNFGTDTCLRVFWDYGSPTISNYSYLKADFSGIPASAIVADASIHLYALQVNNSADHTMSLQRLTTTWTETGITWATYPNATGVGAVTMTNAATSVTGWQDFDMTAITRYQVTNPTQNFGCRILLQAQSGTSDKGVIYASTENTNANIRPYVVVEYYLPQTDTIYFESTKDARVYSGATTTNFGTDSVLAAYWDAGTNSYANRAFMYADLSDIPKDAAISRANLYMYALSVNNAADHPLYIEAVSSASWTENGITWANQPSVGAAYRSGISHASTSSIGWHTMSVINLAKYAVWSPEKNLGWRIALQTETGTLDKGIFYASGEHSNSSLRPYLVVEYFDPIVISGYVNHCTNGSNNGSITPEYSGGAMLYTNYSWQKLESGALSTVETGTDMSQIGVSGLSDGLYLLEIKDYCGIKGYQYFFVGEEGSTTTVSFAISNSASRAAYIEDSYLTYYKSTGDSVTIGGSATTIGTYTNTSVNSRAIIKHKVDWDPSLEFTSCRQAVTNKGGCYQITTSDNDAYVSRITEDWGEFYATWATRPDVTTLDRVYIPTTTTNGYENRNDTFNILAFVPYWQEHPDENFGIDLALKTYNQPALATRDYNSSDQGAVSLIVSFTVKPKIETFYYDSLGTGDILVNAPAGELPYTYFLSYQPIQSLNEIWTAVKDSIPIDSASFFNGKSNTRNYSFDHLEPDRYYVTVFDNNGNKLMGDSILITGDFDLYHPSNIIETSAGSGRFKAGADPVGRGYTSFNLVLPSKEDGGFEFGIRTLGPMMIGFNRAADSIVQYNQAGFEFGLNITQTGSFNVIVNGVVVSSGLARVNDNIRLIRDKKDFVLFINRSEQFRISAGQSYGDDLRLEMTMFTKTGEVFMLSQVAKLKPPKPVNIKVNNAECNLDNGSIQVFSVGYASWGITHFSYQLIDQSNNQIVATGTNFSVITSLPFTLNVPPGNYTMIFTWNGISGPVSYSQNITLSYEIYWNILNNMVLNTASVNTIYSTPIFVQGEAISQNILPAQQNGWFVTNVGYGKAFSPFGGPALHSPSYAVISVFDDLNQAEFVIGVYGFGAGIINKHVIVNDGYPSFTNIGSQWISTNGPIRVDFENGDAMVKLQGSSIPLVTVGYDVMKNHRIDAVGFNANIHDSYASFCSGLTTSDVCGHLDYELNGNYYVTTTDKFCFVYNEEYNDPSIVFNIYDNSGNIVATQNNFLLPAMIHGENRVILDFAGMECFFGGFYILEVINAKGEKFYLRFHIASVICNPCIEVSDCYK